MNKCRKLKVIEQGLYAALLIVIGLGGYFYERFRGDLPNWQLVGLIIAGYIAAFGLYRIALSLAAKKLG
jgi:hypothetical protein